MMKTPIDRQDGHSFLDGASDMAALISSHDWAATALGPISAWSQALRTTVSLCLASNFPINIIWGEGNVQIYNDGYRVVCGDKHPAALGMDYTECWASAWPAIGRPFEQAREGSTSFLENQRMFLFRNDYLEETFFTFSLSPIRDETGGIGGLFHPVTETTATMLGERRTRLVRDLTTQLASVGTRADVCRVTAATLAQHAFDIPFMLIYLRDDDSGAFALADSFGIAAGTTLSRPQMRFDAAAGWPPALLGQGGIAERRGLRGELSGDPCGPYDEAPDTAFAMPVNGGQDTLPEVILVAGASARLPMTDDYRGVYDLVAAACGAALTRVKAAEDERRRGEALAAIDRAKTAFFSNVSHEFRTPLTLMIGPLEDALASGELAPASAANVGTAHRNALRLQKLVNSLLDFSRIEAGRNDARFAATDLARLTVELASSFESACARAGLGLTVDCDLPAPVYVDRGMWETIVLNLLSNAFKFTLEGAIAVTLRADGGQAELTVTDTGVGLPADQRERVFERFHRVEQQAGRSVEGSGIGLSLVRELVRLHGGDITAGSNPVAHGTAFTVRIPLGAAHLPAAQIKAAEVPGDARRAAQFAGEAMRWVEAREPSFAGAAVGHQAERPYIVLADDNADMRAYVGRLLVDGGYRVAAFGNGADALAHALAGPAPELILSDVMMPRLDGFQLLQAVRAEEALRDTLVILLSAKSGEEARVEGLAAGADDYMVKPFSARELRARIDAALRLRRQRAEAAEREQSLLLAIADERSRAALLASEAHIDSFFEQDAAGVVEAGRDGAILRANARFDAIVGRPAGATLGADLRQLIHPDDADDNAALMARLFERGTAFNVENRYVAADGRTVWVSKAVTGIRARPGQLPVSSLAVVLDISARKRVEAELSDTSRRKDEFLAMLAHELRNPLAPISAAAQLMALAQHDVQRVRQTSEVIARQVTHMTALVDDLLDVSRVTRGLITIDRSQQEMKSVIAASIEQARPIMVARRHRLVIDLTPEPDYVEGDRKRLVQIVTNLLNNAAKYTPEGGTVHVRTELHDGQILVSVRDNGVGIDPDQQAHMFELFAQAERSSDRSQGGLGLGLALVRSLTELHGGSVGVDSAGIGHGCCFTVRLPLMRLHDGADEAEPPAPGAAPWGAKRRVLVVDDNIDAARMLAMVLQVMGHEVVVAHTSFDALDLAARTSLDACVLDIGLPDLDGNELARRLRAAPGTRDATLIALTGYSQEQDRARAVAAGFDHFMVKPVDIGKLTAALAPADTARQ